VHEKYNNYIQGICVGLVWLWSRSLDFITAQPSWCKWRKIVLFG